MPVFIAATLFGGTGAIYPSCSDSVLSKRCTGKEWGKALLIFPQHVNGIEGFVEWKWRRVESKTIQLGIKIGTQTGSVEGLLLQNPRQPLLVAGCLSNKVPSSLPFLTPC